MTVELRSRQAALAVHAAVANVVPRAIATRRFWTRRTFIAIILALSAPPAGVALVNAIRRDDPQLTQRIAEDEQRTEDGDLKPVEERSDDEDVESRPNAGPNTDDKPGTAGEGRAPGGGAQVAPSTGLPLIAIGTGLDHEGGLYTVRSDGRDLEEISRGLEQAHDPVWSPDGRSIAFDGTSRVTDGSRPSEGGIYRIDRDGSNQRLLTPDGSGPDWAPDGSRIVFTWGDGQTGSQTDIGVMRPDGTGRIRLTSSLTSEGSPQWSPRGDWIAFIADSSSLQVIRPDGTGARRVSAPGSIVAAPVAWSPDGRSIAFVASAPAVDQYVYIADIDGGEPRRIAQAVAGGTRDVSWSPDGRSLAYRGVDGLIWTVRRDGTGARAFTERDPDSGFHTCPAWSPDGAQIAHIRSEGSNQTVWVRSVSGGPARRIAAVPQPASSLAYEPSVG